MSLLEDAQVNSTTLSSTKEEILMREIILTHDPDDHYLDSEQLLHLVDSAFHPTADNVIAFFCISIKKKFGWYNPLGLLI